MADNIALGQQLPAAVFDPMPDPEILPRNLVIAGIYIASAAILSVVRPLPHLVMALDIYIQCIVALIMIALFGVVMVLMGWMVADSPERFAAFGRIMMRLSHIMLIFAIALHHHASFTTQADASVKNNAP